jgi:hypothetical protein
LLRRGSFLWLAVVVGVISVGLVLQRTWLFSGLLGVLSVKMQGYFVIFYFLRIVPAICTATVDY